MLMTRWMCNNSNPSGADNSYENLLPQGHRLHAVYLATVAKHALVNWGINFQTIEAFNEPDIRWSWNGTQVRCPRPTASDAPLLVFQPFRYAC